MKILITSIIDVKRVAHNRVHVLAEYLSRKHDVTMLCLNAWWLEQSASGQHGERYHDDGVFKEMFDRFQVHYMNQRRDPPILQQLTTLPSLNALLPGIRLSSFDVHVNYGDLIAGYSVGRAARRVGLPTVFDIADDLPHSFGLSPRVPRWLRPLARGVAGTMLRANVNLAARVTFVTETLGDAYRLPNGKSILVPNGVHESFFSDPPEPSMRNELGLDETFVLGFVGAQLEWVDLQPAFRALRRLDGEGLDVRMLVVGGGEKLQANGQLAAECGVSDRVVFTDQVPLSQVPSYIGCMDVCLICRAETVDSDRSLPLKLFEYMACQKPVISVPLSGVREAVADRVLYARTADQLADSILRLHQDQRLWDRMGLQGREFVRERYGWSSICRQFEGVLTAAVGESVNQDRVS